jgi:hypothetical protein
MVFCLSQTQGFASEPILNKKTNKNRLLKSQSIFISFNTIP